VTAEPPSSVLILTDFKGSTFDAAALRAIKETAHSRRSFAMVGTGLGLAGKVDGRRVLNLFV